MPLKALSDNASIPIFQLTETYRLSKRAANFTGLFYKDNLKSKAKKDIRVSFKEIESDFGKYLNPKGGPVLMKTDMKAGEYRPINALRIATVLAYFIETTMSLQKSIYQTVGYNKNLLIETVSRVQGLTTDITIYIIPNASYHRSLEARLFNVATSRSKRHTIIIADENVINRSQVDSTVKRFLNKLDKDFSFFIPGNSELKKISF